MRELREAQKILEPADFSLRKFAERVGISPTFLSQIENDKLSPPAPRHIVKMAELLKVDPDKLLALAGKVDPDLDELIMTRPEIAHFLRMTKERNVSTDRIQEITRRLAEE
mgnify:CR=1 FL=1